MAVFEHTPSARLSQAGFSKLLRVARKLPEHLEHLFSGDDQEAEGQVSGHFDWSPDMDMPLSTLPLCSGV